MRLLVIGSVLVCAACHRQPSFASLATPLTVPGCHSSFVRPAAHSLPTGRGLWSDRDGVGNATLSLATVQTRLAGTYRVIEVQSEGDAWTKPVRIWQLALRPVPLDSAEASPSTKKQSNGFVHSTYAPPGARALRGERRLLAEGTLARVRPVRSPPPSQPVRVRVLSSGAVELDMSPQDGPEASVRTYVLLHAPEAGPLTGRWFAGGMMQLVVPTAIGALVEIESGYFCAFPETP